jgi:TRAP-type C4-dicarboxylate transport system substrate-binding protein
MGAGQLDCCGCTALGVLETCPEAAVLLVPGLFNSFEEVDYIFEKFRKRLDDGFEKKGYVLWALIDTGFFYMFSTTKTTGLEDIKKQKVLTWFGSIETTFFKELGITPKPVAVPDIVAALNTGAAETNVAPAAWMLGMQAYQYSNYYIKPPLLYSPAAVIVSVDKKQKIQKQLGVSAVFAHNIIEALAAEWNLVEPEWRRQIRMYEEKSLKAFETKCGMKSVTLSAEDQAVLQKANKAVAQKLTGTVFPGDLLGEIQKALEEFRARKH